MKKLTVLFATLLVLVSSIVFCACGNDYDKLKISCNVDEIKLVLDYDKLSTQEVVFEVDGVKSWGKVSIGSKPAGLVQTEHEVSGTKCGVVVKALQPTEQGASLVITHLGSGKSFSVPLTIGMQLQTVESTNKEFIIETPKFSEELTEQRFDIPVESLLKCVPENYTDIIAWEFYEENTIAGLNIISYDIDGNETNAFNINSGIENIEELQKLPGTSSAVKSQLLINKDFVATSSTMVKINPVSILDGIATLHKDVVIDVCILDLLQKEDITLTSDTHGNDNGLLSDLVLISNPDKDNQREIDGLDGYDFYSTAIIDLKTTGADGLKDLVYFKEKLEDIHWEDIYNIEMSTDIDALQLEIVDFGKIRVIATSTCVGSGVIEVKFTPKDCIGDINSFSITIPCVVGERATNFRAFNSGDRVSVTRVDENDAYNFKSTTPLYDSTSIGQPFRFEVLSTNTLDALKQYRITIDKSLLHIEINYSKLTEEPEDWEEGYSRYYKYNDISKKYEKVNDVSTPNFDDGEYFVAVNSYIKTVDYNLIETKPALWDYDWKQYYTVVDGEYIKVTSKQCPEFAAGVYYEQIVGGFDISTLNKKEYQISILKDGREITFYEDGDNFVSEPLNSTNTIYMKWVKTDSKDSITDTDFGVTISNYYNQKYDIKNNGFADTQIHYTLRFDRQRTVESVSYIPVKISGNAITPVEDAKKGWQFYLTPEMLESSTYYGVMVLQVLGINGTQLTNDELANINLKFTTTNENLGCFEYDDGTLKEIGENHAFNFISDKENIIVLRKIDDDEDIKYGDWKLNVTQDNSNNPNPISKVDIRIYKELTNESVSVTLPTAEFEGELLTYEYILLEQKPADWETAIDADNHNIYYEYAGGGYVNVKTTDAFSKNKSYYTKVDEIDLTIDGNDTVLDIENTYIVATNKEYKINMEIIPNGDENYDEYKDYIYISGKEVSSRTVASSETVLPNTYLKCDRDEDGNHIIVTGDYGTYNTTTSEKNFVKLRCVIKSPQYDYYKESDRVKEIVKNIYVYIYEPVTKAVFKKAEDYDNDEIATNLYKYAIDDIVNDELEEEYAKETLKIKLNNGSNTIFNYTDIKWTYTPDGISDFDLVDKSTAKFVFKNGLLNYGKLSGTIIATLTQFGAQYPISCSYEVNRPVLTKRIELITNINTFGAGGGYINLKVNDELLIQANNVSDRIDASGNMMQVSMPGFEYVICNTAGYKIDGVATIDENGKLTAKNAGRAKLIIVAKDRLIKELSSVTDYFTTSEYVVGDAYLIIDIIVSDGSAENPYLIAKGSDFEAIENGSAMHYALVSDIDLGGKAINISSFKGVISSFQESATSNNIFTIYGVLLTEENPNLFTTLESNDDELAVLKNINFNIDINYVSTKRNADEKGDLKEILIGLIGINNAKIENVTVDINGKIDANGKENKYIIGSLVATNTGTGEFKITDTKLVGIQGQIIVTGGNKSTVILGGLIGKNEGTITGASNLSSKTGTGNNVEYDVYYDNQGATVDITLQVKNVDNFKLNDSAIGGVVGYNKGIINNVYSMGKILGQDDANNLTVNNVGGLIGKNEYTHNEDVEFKRTISAETTNLKSIVFDNGNTYQIVNSYSSAQVLGNNNVGGAVGYDWGGSYKKVYYEIYTEQIAVKGNSNVGGLIGYANDSNLNYCYANSFALNYKSSVATYDIVGQINVGGLIGLAVSSNENGFSKTGAMNIINSVASVSLNATSKVGGLIGRLNNYGAIYTAYFYGVINPSIEQINKCAIAQIHINNNVVSNIPYNNVYAIVNGETKLPVDGDLSTLTGFTLDDDSTNKYNNGKPYIKYEDGTNLVSIIPMVVEIKGAFTTEHLKSKMYKENNKSGDYVYNGTSYVNYNPSTDSGKTRYSLMAELKNTDDTTGNNSNYREKVLILYYYPLNNQHDENYLTDYYYLNTIDMHDIVADNGIILLPNTFKRFNLRTSNEGVASVLSGGRLLLNGEGQVTITLISTLNPSATASFVVIVRTKVLDFNLYTSSNIREEYKLQSDTKLNIVNGSSKIIYADYSSTILRYNRPYSYKNPTNMLIKFKITHKTIKNKDEIYKYIRLNGTYNSSTGEYLIVHGQPITITVDDYIEGEFEITANPYVVANYKNGTHEKNIDIELSSYFERTFKVSTKRGASAINTDKIQLDMMPADEESNIDVKISTDTQLPVLYFEIESVGEIYETEIGGTKRQFIEMLDIITSAGKVELDFDKNADDVKTLAKGEINISSITLENNTQSLKNIALKLNDLSHYVDVAFRLQVTFYVLDANGNPIGTTVYINVRPQSISSVIPINYRLEDGKTDLNFENVYQSNVIRPGATNIITIDIAPSIAVYDHIEVMDITAEDRILFKQVKDNLTPMEQMDIWVDDGIKLRKYDTTTSKMYLIAKLPAKATANITHTIQIDVYDKSGNVINTTYLNLEAVMYPTVVLNYIDPNGKTVTTADTRDGNAQQEKVVDANLALGVEAKLTVQTYNIDEGTLNYNIQIKQGDEDKTETFGKFVSLHKIYDGYSLQFNTNKDGWGDLLGKDIYVSFTASKSLNGITETCKATIKFSIRKLVIHSISMYHTSSQGDLYGDWNEQFETYFYFDKTDISYYNEGYWNIQYTMENTNPVYYTGNIKSDMEKIYGILTSFNSWSSNVELKLKNIKNSTIPPVQLTRDYKHYNDEGIEIINELSRFKIKASDTSNINDLKLVVNFGFDYADQYPSLSTNSSDRTISKEFGFNISKKTTPFDEYILIRTEQEFNDMLEGKYYRLANNITLNNFTPINTAIGGLNGDGYIVTIQSFNEAQLIQDYVSTGMYVGLFGVLPINSVIQNLKVNYNRIVLNLNDKPAIEETHTNDIYFGGIAGQNLGVITNVKVFGSIAILSQAISATHIDLGGITAINGSSDSEKVATITGSTADIDMSAMGLVGGISGTNYGKITTSSFNGTITSKDSNQYVAEVTTAGFVVENMADAYISLSYVESGLVGSESDIHSVGRTAGFVLNNSGTIKNCYVSKTSLATQGNIGGFVYQNTGEISNSYSYATVASSVFYNEFIHSTSSGGKLTNCYVVTEKKPNISGLTPIQPSQVSLQENYAGFIFAKSKYGIWSISAEGPKLLNSGFNSNKNDYDNTFNIYDVETFEGYFEKFQDTIEGKIFRLVRDIDFEQENFEENPVTYNKVLQSNFDGNDMAIINYNIHKTEGVDSIGLFAGIKNAGLGIYVRNLILKPASIKASNSVAVGALAGTIDSVNIYNINIDNINLLMLGKNAVGGLAGVVKGSFEVIGVTSNVSVFAGYKYNIASQYNLYMGKNVNGNTLLDNIDKVSYGGSVAGIVDGYNSSSFDFGNRNITNYYTISDITIDGDVVLIAETVGGAFGLVGERTLVKNVNYNLSKETLYQGIYVSGGLVGENRGIVQSSNIYAFNYEDGIRVKERTIDCFDKSARVNGAIVGVNIGGLIDNCTSDIDVNSTVNTVTTGGIVGRNIEGSIYNCKVSRNVSGYYMGGIAGTDYSHSTIIAQNVGIGTATFMTQKVYKLIQNKVVYNSNCLVRGIYISNELFSNNILTNEFVNNFITNSKKYYAFNTSYLDDNTKPLVNTSAVYGLVIGMSDSGYATKINKDRTTIALTISLTITEPSSTNDEITSNQGIQVMYGGKEITIYPIQSHADESMEYGTLKAVLLYIIAYDSCVGFDSWNSTHGYKNEYIALYQPVKNN